MKLLLYPKKTKQPPSGLIYFLHIPKTGGITLRDIISRQYKRFEICTVPTLKESKQFLENISELTINQLKFIQGHMKFGIHTVLNKPSKYITFLRDPIQRVISLYTYILQVKNHPYNLSTADKTMSIEEFIESGQDSLLINGQTQLISGITVDQNDPLNHSKELLEKAKKNIDDHFTFIGLLEQFDESLLLMKEILNWKTLYYSQANRSKKKDVKVSEETMGLLKSMNELDLELYEYIKYRFNNAMPRITDQLNGFLRKNKMLKPLYSYNRINRLIIRKLKK